MPHSKPANLQRQVNDYLAASGRSDVARLVNGTAAAHVSAGEKGAPHRVGERQRTRTVGGYPTVSPQEIAAPSAPINNMGENSGGAVEAMELVLSDSGEVKQVMVRVPAPGQVCIVDWVNFTVAEDTWHRTARQTLVSDEEIIVEASRHLEKIFGFGITSKRDRGMNFYRDSWVLGDDMGFVCFGGQRATMLITLTGLGCVNAVSGWENRLARFLDTVAVRPRLTRIDLAHDDFQGAYLSVDWAEKQYHLGGYQFKRGGTPPCVERIGNWHRPRGAGRTFTVGQRTSGKFTRFYEKGKKEGDRNSNWCRVEVEFKSSDRVIPIAALTSPSEFFAAAYPCFTEFVEQATLTRMELKQKTAQVVIDACVEVTRRQFGKYIRVFRDLWGDAKTLDMISCADKDAWPKRMKPITSSHTTGDLPIHHETRVLEFIKFINAARSFGLHRDDCTAEAI